MATPSTILLGWLRKRQHRVHLNPPPLPNLMYLPDLKDALKSRMHAKYGLKSADCKAGYYT
eukprot:1123108-Pelagomonas_calceolata.AAC.1